MTDNANPTPALLDPELHLLQAQGSVPLTDTVVNHTFKTAPVFTGDAYEVLGDRCLPQRAIYGTLLSQHGPDAMGMVRSPKLFVNMNTPFSALVCGVQVCGAFDMCGYC